MSFAEHSALIASTKGKTESILSNYSSNSYLSILDRMYFNALEPILFNSNFIELHLASLVAWYSNTQRRKIAGEDKEITVSKILVFLNTKDKHRKLYLFKDIGLERNIYLLIIEDFARLTSGYVKAHHKNLTLSLADEQIEDTTVVEKSVHWLNDGLYGVVKLVNRWKDISITFKQQIMEKYIRLAVLQAAKDYAIYAYKISIDDLFQNYMIAVSKAIDKSNPNKGVLTSYILDWFKNAKLNTAAMYNYTAAFTTPNSKYNFGNTTVDIDSEECSYLSMDESESDEDSEQVARIAQTVDPLGIGRLAFGISQYFSVGQVKFMTSK